MQVETGRETQMRCGGKNRPGRSTCEQEKEGKTDKDRKWYILGWSERGAECAKNSRSAERVLIQRPER